ncbi:hypothetical protein [Candidatus Nitrospira bockiana]
MWTERPPEETPAWPGRARRLLQAVLLFTLGGLTGCLSPIAMHRAVLEYDRTTSRVEAELLLLNIARARHYRPLHFTAVSSVAATFDFRVNAGISGSIGRAVDPDQRPITLDYSTTVAENPTITIIPITGEEFTKRVLRPFEEAHVEFLAHQGFDINMILRLMARSITMESHGGRRVLFNAASRGGSYEEFRRRLLHLAGLDEARRLFIEPVTYEEAFPLAGDRPLSPADAVAALEHGYRWSMPADGRPAALIKKVVGRIAITNYDVTLLSNEERHRLNEAIERYSRDSVFVDIRPGFPGGDYPMRGTIQLRSFNAILAFVARGIAEEPGFHVDPDPRTGFVPRNPAHVLDVEEADRAPADAEFAVEFEGKAYFIRKVPLSQGMVPSWNQEAFAVLANLFQMTVTDVSGAKTPIISIPKGG